jgi:hypothetical protein
MTPARENTGVTNRFSSGMTLPTKTSEMLFASLM